VLIYHPAYDAYHCVFRTLVVTQVVNKMEIARLRIIDFFFVFPAEYKHIALPKQFITGRAVLSKLANEFHGPVNMFQAFKDMEHIQVAAISTLAASGIFDATALEQGIVQRTTAAISSDLQEKIDLAVADAGPKMDFIVRGLSEIPLLGFDGLKRRSGLMEYRYDVA